MYVSMSRLLVDQGRTPELIEAFRRRMRLVDTVYGFDPDLDRAIKLERLEHMHTYEVVAD